MHLNEERWGMLWCGGSCLHTTHPSASCIYLTHSLYFTHFYLMHHHSLTHCLTSLFIPSLKPTSLFVLHSLPPISYPCLPHPWTHFLHQQNSLTPYLTLPNSSGCRESTVDEYIIFSHSIRLCGFEENRYMPFTTPDLRNKHSVWLLV